MSRTIAIIAPHSSSRQFPGEFNLRFRDGERELTLAALYEQARRKNGPVPGTIGMSYQEDIPSAGYYLEGLLRSRGYDTALTLHTDPQTLEDLARKDLLAVCLSTTMVITTAALTEILTAVRRALPGICIIAGGVLIWKHYLLHLRQQELPADLPQDERGLFHPANAAIPADLLIAAPHGTASLLQVLEQLEKGTAADFTAIPNLVIPGKQGFQFTRREEERVNYNEDFTRWDLVEEVPSKIPLRTSIGCPYRCRFCDFYPLFPKIFLRSPVSLSRELSMARSRLGTRPGILHVSDDNVFINRKRLQEVCTTITESGLKRWMSFFRSREFDENELKMIQQSGLLMGFIGVESGDDMILERMNKRQVAAGMKRGIEQLDALGISVLMTFVSGFPGENAETLSNTIGFLNDLDLKTLSASYVVFPLMVEPLSGLSEPETRRRWNIDGMMYDWSHETMNRAGAEQAAVRIFREVTEVPYHYRDESFFFNRAKFNFDTRKALFRLRHRLTVAVMDNAPAAARNEILQEMVHLMGIHEFDPVRMEVEGFSN